MNCIELKNVNLDPAFFSRCTQILQRQIQERIGCAIFSQSNSDLQLSFEIQKQHEFEGYTLTYESASKIHIISGSNRGILYGLGKFLHTSQYKPQEFIPSVWQGTSHPIKPVRGIYFATHFFNFYHAAPLERIQQYVEDLALWGYNVVIVWFDMHHFIGIHDPKAQEFLIRLRKILSTTKELGLNIGIPVIANEAYANSPKELRADQVSNDFKRLRGGYALELCPYKPGAVELMLSWFREEFQAFADLSLDYLWIWPYDQGGCACDQCHPWGANGFLVMAEKIAILARQSFPKIKIVLSTWLFDKRPNEGEWEGLAEKFRSPPTWVDYIMADAHFDFPEFPLTHGVPGNLPMLNFPEISMYEMIPWGGFGANPLVQRFQHLWDIVGSHLAGGFPYSEGIFEDLNKVILSQFYWDGHSAILTLKEYIVYNFPGCDAADLQEAFLILEQNHQGFRRKKNSQIKKTDHGSATAYALFQQHQEKLPSYITSSWRWRIVYLRSVLDYHRFQDSIYPTEPVIVAFNELTKIYFAQQAEYSVRPYRLQQNPIIKWIGKLRTNRTKTH